MFSKKSKQRIMELSQESGISLPNLEDRMDFMRWWKQVLPQLKLSKNDFQYLADRCTADETDGRFIHLLRKVILDQMGCMQ